MSATEVFWLLCELLHCFMSWWGLVAHWCVWVRPQQPHRVEVPMYMLEREKSQLFTQMQTTLKAPKHHQRFSNIQNEKIIFSVVRIKVRACWICHTLKYDSCLSTQCHTVAHSDHFNGWQGKMKTITQLLYIVNCIYSLHLVISRCSFTAHTTDREEEEEEEHCVSLPHKRECSKNCLLYVFPSPSVDSTCWPHCALVVHIADSLWHREPVKRHKQ